MVGNDTTITETIIPDRVYGSSTGNLYTITEIGANGFQSYKSLTSVILPSTLQTIKTHAFAGCSNIVDLSLPDNISSLGDYAFSSMTSLKEFTLPKYVASIPYHLFESTTALEVLNVDPENTVYYSENNCIIRRTNKAIVRGCNTSVIPSGVLRIMSNSFEGSNIETLEIPNTIQSISPWAFNKCKELTTVNIPESLTSIKERSFSSCVKLTNITFAITTGWTAGTDELQSTQLALPATAGLYLRSTYVKVNWTRTNVA